MARALIKMVRPDNKGRIMLGHLADGVSRFSVMEDKERHLIILEPYAEIPAREKWLFNNKGALNKVKRGLKDSAEGRVCKRGSFVQYTNRDDE